MHQLHLLRHTKSSWDEDTDDRERPLNKRGREAARLVGEALPTTIGALDLVLCSSALRTRETAQLALAGFGKELQLLFEDQLYLANRTTLLERLRQIDEPMGSVMVIGHNPGLHELALALAAPASAGYKALAEGKFPTGVRASFAVATRWSAIESEHHRLAGYVTVKSLGGKD